MSDLQKAGKYEILSRIGEGGFGVVYQGRDPFIKRMVAIKTCNSENEETRRRFLREAEIAGNIEHPNITVLYDFGYEDDTPYLVQEFLSGEDLDEKISSSEHIPLATKLDYLLQIAQGLGFAHEQGITHRDIKPSNIRILDDDRVKIMDFGIAKLASVETQLTQTGTTLGTPAYLSPEQLRGDEVDQRSDIYSYGVMAFEVLTGRRLYEADSISALFFQILHQKPTKLSEVWSECPPDLEALVERCIEKDCAKRISSFRDVIAVLQKVLDEVRSSGLDFSTSAILKSPRDDKAERTRREAMTEARNQIENLLASGDLKHAARALLEARETFGDAVPFRTLHDRLVQLQTAAQVELVDESPELRAEVQRIQGLIGSGQLDQAAAAHEKAIERFSEGPSLIAVGRRIKVHRRLNEGRQYLNRGQFAEAEQVVMRALELDPDNPEVSSVLRLVKAGRAHEEATALTPAAAGATAAAPIRDRTAAAAADATALGPKAGATVVGAAAGRTAPAPIAPPPVPAPAPAAPAPAPSQVGRSAGTSRAGIAPWKIAAAVGALVVVAVVLYMALGTGGGGTAQPVTVVVDALPWAEVVGIVDGNGEPVELQRPAYTPLSLQLAPGEYQVTLQNPSFGGERTVAVRVRAGQTVAPVELEKLGADRYFQEIGW